MRTRHSGAGADYAGPATGAAVDLRSAAEPCAEALLALLEIGRAGHGSPVLNLRASLGDVIEEAHDCVGEWRATPSRQEFADFFQLPAGLNGGQQSGGLLVGLPRGPLSLPARGSPKLGHLRRIYDLTDGLIRRKYTDEQIRPILGENWRRVLSEIWTPIA
jgi:hypothetical protein